MEAGCPGWPAGSVRRGDFYPVFIWKNFYLAQPGWMFVYITWSNNFTELLFCFKIRLNCACVYKKSIPVNWDKCSYEKLSPALARSHLNQPRSRQGGLARLSYEHIFIFNIFLKEHFPLKMCWKSQLTEPVRSTGTAHLHMNSPLDGVFWYYFLPKIFWLLIEIFLGEIFPIR